MQISVTMCCYQRIKAAQKAEHLADRPEYTETCGKCQALLPCSFSAGMDSGGRKAGGGRGRERNADHLL